MNFGYIHKFVRVCTHNVPLGQKSLEMAHERRGVCFKLWVKNLAAVFFNHLAHTLGMFCGILNKTHVANSQTAFGQLFWFSGKCVFVQKVLKRIIQNTPRKGPVFGHMDIYICIYTYTHTYTIKGLLAMALYDTFHENAISPKSTDVEKRISRYLAVQIQIEILN